MMTDRRTTFLLATAAVLIGLTLTPAKATDSLSKIRTAANIDVPASRAGKTTPVVRSHHRKTANKAARWARRSIAAPAGLVHVAYRPATETVCGSNTCGVPIVLFIGIAY